MKQLVNGIRIHYEDVGDGPALLFIHGFPLDHTLWTHQIQGLKDDYRLIAPDLRGHGQTHAPPDPYRMDLMADDLCALIQTLDVKKVVLVGLSMGGYVALAFWRVYPHLVQALVLTDTHAAADTPDSRLNRQAMVRRVKAEGSATVVAEMLPKLLSPATWKKSEVVEHARRMMDATPPAGMIGALQGLAERPDSTSTLATITVPTLIITGQDDALTPPAQAKAMRDAILVRRRGRTTIPEVALSIIPQAGHLTPLENPAAFNQTLREFLAGLTN